MHKLKLHPIDEYKLSLLDEDTRELIIEFRHTLDNEYSCYTASILLFGVIIMHMADDITDGGPEDLEEAIDLLHEELEFKDETHDLLLDFGELIDQIMYEYNVLYKGDETIINTAWNFIKWMVEEVMN